MSDHEYLVAIYGRLWYGVALGVVILVLLVATLVSKWVIRREMVHYLRRPNEIYERTGALLEAVEGWGESGRAARKDTAAALQTFAVGPTREELATKIDEVPGKTVEKLKEHDSRKD